MGTSIPQLEGSHTMAGIPFSQRVPLRKKRKANFDLGTTNSLVQTMLGVFEEYFAEGNPPSVVCDLIGVSTITYRSWIKRGEDYESALIGGNQNEDDHPFYEFVLAVRKAQAMFLRDRVLSLTSRYNRKWQRDMAILERRDRSNWGKDTFDTRADEYDPDESFL